MVIIRLTSIGHFEYYCRDLSAGGLVKGRDYVYSVLPSELEDRSDIRVGFEFLADSYSSYYGLKWS